MCSGPVVAPSNDGMVPPPYLGTTFDGTQTHYLTSGATVIDAADILVWQHLIGLHLHWLVLPITFIILVAAVRTTTFC